MPYLSRNFLLRKLTHREFEILRLVFAGNTSKQIAKLLEISPRTVEVHRANLMHRLGVSSMAQLADVVLKAQQELENLLMRSEAHLQEAQRIAHLGSWSCDVATGVNIWSEEMFRIFGYAPNAVIPTSDLYFAHILSEDRDRVKEALTSTLVHESAYDLQYQIARTDGEIRNIKAKGIVEKNVSGTAVRMTGIIIDITESVAAQNTIAIGEKKFSFIFENSPIAMAITRVSDGTFIDANAAFLEFYGYSRGEVIGHTSLELEMWVNPELRGPVISLLQENGNLRNIAVDCRKKSGEISRVLASSQQIELHGEQCIIGFLTVIDSIAP